MLEKIAKELPLPALLLDVDAFDKNCKEIAEKAQRKTIRVASKSIRSVPVLKRIFQSSPVFQGIMSYSPYEAIFLADQGFSDILIGYPFWDEQAYIEIAKRNKDGRIITIMIDSLEHVQHVKNILANVDGKFYICIDIDMSTTFGTLHFGVRRSPLKTPEQVLNLATTIRETEGLELVGVMGYEAQIAGVGDAAPSQWVKNQLIKFLKRRSMKEILDRRKTIVHALKKEGVANLFVNGGGTGSLHSTSEDETVTELTAGSGFYAPLLFDYYRDFKYSPSLFFALPVVRKPAPNIYTCLGGGYIASGPHGADKVPQPYIPSGGKLLPFEGAGEVQTPVYFKNQSLDIGDAILFRAAKAGEICERFNHMYCISNGEVKEQYLTYRGEGKCFL